MYDDGYTHLTAFDYAEEGIACAKKFFGSRWLVEGRYNNQNNRKHVDGVDLHVADARNLPFDSDTFDAVLEKGTLDAVYLSGGKDKEIASEHLNMAIKELSRVVRQGGVVMSISAACADSIQSAFINTKSNKLFGKDVSVELGKKSFDNNSNPRFKGKTITYDTFFSLLLAAHDSFLNMYVPKLIS